MRSRGGQSVELFRCEARVAAVDIGGLRWISESLAIFKLETQPFIGMPPLAALDVRSALEFTASERSCRWLVSYWLQLSDLD
jgi:hypothetical protein